MNPTNPGSALFVFVPDPLDADGHRLTLGGRVTRDGRAGKIIAVVGPRHVHIRWDDSEDSTCQLADNLRAEPQ